VIPAVPRGKSALTRVLQHTTVTVKAIITDTFVNLNNWVILSEDPTITITSGMLTGNGAVRHRDQMASDNFRVSATIGDDNSGKTILVACASDSFDRFYGVEVESGGTNKFHIVKGTSVVATTSTGIFGILIGLLGFFLGSFGSVATIPKYASVNQTVDVGDVVTVWWDQPNSTVRAYKNGAEVTNLPVSPWEIPHGDGYRYWGVMQGVDDTTGVQFTSITADDV
jgi:hypothetical protein